MNDNASETVETDRSAPISRQSLHDELVQRLRSMVIEGDLTPGSRVPERVLCERFAVSRTPLREAMKVLASEGLLELTPHRGAVVPCLTLEDLEEVFPVLGALEGLAGELACKHVTEEDLAEVRALHYQMVLHYQRSELPEYFRLNQAIHEKIMAVAGNATLLDQHRSLAGRVRRARYQANMSAGRWKHAVEEHEEILKALTARDAERLGRILKQHLQNKCETVKEALLAESGQGGPTGPGGR